MPIKLDVCLANLDSSPMTLDLANHVDQESTRPTPEAQAVWYVVVDEKPTRHELNAHCVRSARSRRMTVNVNCVQWASSRRCLARVNVIPVELERK